MFFWFFFYFIFNCVPLEKYNPDRIIIETSGSAFPGTFFSQFAEKGKEKKKKKKRKEYIQLKPHSYASSYSMANPPNRG